MTKYVSHAGSASAAGQAKDGDVTEILNRTHSVAPFLDSTFWVSFLCVDPLRNKQREYDGTQRNNHAHHKAYTQVSRPGTYPGTAMISFSRL